MNAAAMSLLSSRVRSSRVVLLTVVCVTAAVLVTGCALLGTRNPGPAGPASVTGKITSDRGAILADVLVTLSGPSVHRTARTDVAGRFTFERVPLGRYVVSAAAAGFKNVKQRVTIDKEDVVHVDLKLKM